PIKASLHCEMETVEVCADRDLISIAFSEILSNAGKALDRAPEPQFDLTVSIDADSIIQLRFCNNGPPVPPNLSERIFEDLFSSWPGQPGSGLGLGWTRRVMKAHGGSAWLVPSQSGGACFGISLPRAWKGATANA